MSDYDGVSEFQRGPSPVPTGMQGAYISDDEVTRKLLGDLTENVTELIELVDQDVDNLLKLQSRSFQQEAHLKSVAGRIDDLSWRTVLMFGWSFGNTLAILYVAANS